MMYAGWAYGQGDTIILACAYEDTGHYRQFYPAVAISPDNGETWSPWTILGNLGDVSHDWISWPVFVSQAILCQAQTQDATGFYRTTDLGQTWQPPYTSVPSLAFWDQRGDTLFCSKFGDSLTWTADLGQTFAPSRSAGFGDDPYITDGAVSQNRVHVVSYLRGNYPRQRIRYTSAPLLSGPFLPVQILDDQIYWVGSCRMRFASDGTGVILSTLDYAYPAPGWEAVGINITQDDGQTWSPLDTVLTRETADPWMIGLLNHDRLWLACWRDTVAADGFATGGLYCKFSANHGRYWFPNQQIAEYDWLTGPGGDIVGDMTEARIRLYASLSYQLSTQYFFQWEGILHPDTLAPVVTPLSLPPDTVEVNSQQLFLAAITDDDTLFQERLRVRSASDTVTIPMEWTGTDFMAYWTVPEEGRYWYRIEGEDFWENVGSYPDTGWAMLVTPGWTDKADDPLLVSPLSFLLSIFPNPANGPISLSLSPDWFRFGLIEISVFNLLGETVWKQQAPSTSGTIRLAPDHLSSGIYLLHVSNPHHSTLQKLLILK